MGLISSVCKNEFKLNIYLEWIRSVKGVVREFL